MNRLDRTTRAQILHLLCEGQSIRAITRLTGCSKNTVAKLLVSAGHACAAYQDKALRNLTCQRIQMDGVTTYKVRKPNGFVIDYASAMKPRSFYYDGKNFTVYSPKLGFYAQVPAPATNKEVLDTLYKRYGIALPPSPCLVSRLA